MGKKKRSKSGNPAAGSAQIDAGVRTAAPVAQSTYSVAGSKKSSVGFYTTAWFEWLAIAVVSALSYWLLTVRLVGVNVSVLIDEYSYVLDSHYRALNEAAYPNHLFQLVFSVTKQCGAEFYSCARSLNAVFVIAGATFLYLLAKHVSGKKWLSALAAIAAVLGSYGTYTAYFMPEAIFNFPMIVFYWALIRFGNTNNLLAWAGFGTILGIASLAKPHAFFVVPALVIFIFLWTRATKDKFFVAAISRIGSFGVALLATKFGVGYLIAGDKALSIFGSYGGAISTGEAVATTLGTNTWLNVPGTSWGQTLMITMILGVALPVAILGFLEIFKKNDMVAEANRVRAVVGISLLNMMAVVAVFEAWQNLTTWMHTRYYSYLIPLAVIALIEAYSRSGTTLKPIVKRIIVGIFFVLALVALFTAAIPYGANWIDAPDFRFHIDNIVLSSILIIVSIALALWWLWDNKKPMLGAIVVALIASVFSGTHISNFLVASFGQDSVHDQLGRVLRNYLPPVELDSTVIVGDNHTNAERVLFGTLNGNARFVGGGSTPTDVASLGQGVRWVVTLGEVTLSGVSEPAMTANGFKLYSLSSTTDISPIKNDALQHSSAFLESDNLGWACGSESSVQLGKSVPANGEIDLIIDVSETAAQGEMEFVLGDSSLKGPLPEGVVSLTLSFNNAAPSQELIIRFLGAGSEVQSSEKRFVRIVSAVVNY
jgi:phosphoglycerol transferase